MEESRLAELESRLTRRFSAEIERIRASSSQRSSGTIKPIRLSPLKYSWEEVNERREKGLCIFCEENETPDHHLKHKGLGLVFMDVDDQSFDEEVVELSSAVLTPKGDYTSSVEKKTEMVVTDKKETMEVKDVTDSAMKEPHDVIAEGGREKKPAENELENSVHSSPAIHSFVVESIHEKESIKADSTQTEEISETDDNSSPLWHRWKTKSRDALELDESSGSIGNQAQSHGDKLLQISPPLWLPGSNISLTHLPRQLSQHRLQQQKKKKSCKTFILTKTVLVQALQTLQLKDRYDMRVPEAKLKFAGIEEFPLLANVTSYRFSLYTTKEKHMQSGTSYALEMTMDMFMRIWDPGDFLLIHLKLQGLVSSNPCDQSQFVLLEEDAVRVVEELQVENNGVEKVFGHLVPLQETAGQGWDETLFEVQEFYCVHGGLNDFKHLAFDPGGTNIYTAFDDFVVNHAQWVERNTCEGCSDVLPLATDVGVEDKQACVAAIPEGRMILVEKIGFPARSNTASPWTEGAVLRCCRLWTVLKPRIDRDRTSSEEESYGGFQLRKQTATGQGGPPRREMHQASADCRPARIRVMVITGDNKSTAEAICHEVRVFKAGIDSSSRNLLGKEFMDVLDQKNHLSQTNLGVEVDSSSIWQRWRYKIVIGGTLGILSSRNEQRRSKQSKLLKNWHFKFKQKYGKYDFSANLEVKVFSKGKDLIREKIQVWLLGLRCGLRRGSDIGPRL